jgi:hypothetical protein
VLGKDEAERDAGFETLLSEVLCLVALPLVPWRQATEHLWPNLGPYMLAYGGFEHVYDAPARSRRASW